MANTSEVEKGLNELKRLTGITLAVTTEDSEQEQMALEQIRCLCLAYREKSNKNDLLKSYMIIENELSETRQAQVDEITEKMQAEGKDRHQIQDALMPFDLPMNYREKNERAGDL